MNRNRKLNECDRKLTENRPIKKDTTRTYYKFVIFFLNLNLGVRFIIPKKADVWVILNMLHY